MAFMTMNLSIQGREPFAGNEHSSHTVTGATAVFLCGKSGGKSMAVCAYFCVRVHFLLEIEEKHCKAYGRNAGCCI